MPIPVFINGVEGHTVVRDLFTTSYEQRNVNQAANSIDQAKVDIIVNTIGFPLVGGPAGSMEGGRQIEVAKEILTSKNVPYIVSAPLLIQDIDSWKANGVQGLQTVVLYALPELDGAIETIILGGLIDGERITIIPERVRKLVRRLNAWVHLQKTAPRDRKVSILVSIYLT
jgi:magnesium chelatase subunit H